MTAASSCTGITSAATACLPSRTTLFTGQYPSLHGGTQTDGLAKQHTDPAMTWLDSDTVPTLGDWFRAGGYRTQYRGKWHISHADLLVPGTHDSLMASDDDGRPIPEIVDAYRRADRLDPFGFSGWIGREPHGAHRADCGIVRDGVFADQMVDLFGDLAASRSAGPWLAVASFVNPHDIAFNGFGWSQILGLPPTPDWVPDVPEAPSQSDSFAGRPACQEQWKSLWPKMLYEQEADNSYRRLYHYLHATVDRSIGRVLDALDDSGMADDTIVVLTSDHGDLLGSHGGLMQKWYNAFEETIRVPFVVKGPGITTPTSAPTSRPAMSTSCRRCSVSRASTSSRARDTLGTEHYETRDLPGRDLSGLLTGTVPATDDAAPVYFMTDDDIGRGLTTTNMFTSAPFDPVDAPSRVESVITTLPTGADGTAELWKLNHYFERLDDWYTDHGVPPNPFAPPAAEPFLEVHNLTLDPEERTNRADTEPEARNRLLTVLEEQREAKRLLPRLRNPSA